jgi:hypothetical protein
MIRQLFLFSFFNSVTNRNTVYFRSNTASPVSHPHATDINTLRRTQRPSRSYRSNYTIRGLITDDITEGATGFNTLQTGSDRAHQQTAKAEQISRLCYMTNFKWYLAILHGSLWSSSCLLSPGTLKRTVM